MVHGSWVGQSKAPPVHGNEGDWIDNVHFGTRTVLLQATLRVVNGHGEVLHRGSKWRWGTRDGFYFQRAADVK